MRWPSRKRLTGQGSAAQQTPQPLQGAPVVGLGGAVGKRLDFLMQELNREANTLSSKSVSGEVTAIALELKLLIEQMREQVQNLE